MDKKLAGYCVICGEPVYFLYSDEFSDCIENAGKIEIHFGYGSRRDTDFGKGFVHDICSAKLENLLRIRLDWSQSVSFQTLDLEKTIEKEELHYNDPKEEE